MPPSPPTRSVAVGSSVITVGVPGGTLIMGGGPRRGRGRAGARGGACPRGAERRTIGELTEGAVMTASEATDRVEQAAQLLSDALAGKLVDLSHAGHVLDVLQRLDRDKRYEEWLRYARSVHGVLVLLKRWAELLRLLRTILRSGDEVYRGRPGVGPARARHAPPRRRRLRGGRATARAGAGDQAGPRRRGRARRDRAWPGRPLPAAGGGRVPRAQPRPARCRGGGRRAAARRRRGGRSGDHPAWARSLSAWPSKDAES